MAPVDINYQPISEYLEKNYGSVLGSGSSRDTFEQISIIKRKVSGQKLEEFSETIIKLLDELEISQIELFKLYPGLKQGLASLKTMKIRTALLSNIGKAATERFLEMNDLRESFSVLFPRDAGTIGQISDTKIRLDQVMKELGQKPSECMFFCNRLSQLQDGKTIKIRTFVLPGGKDRIDLLVKNKPDGMLLSLEELPGLLSIEASRTAKISSSNMRPNQEKDPATEGAV